jgi:pyruvate dehydrogenase (quinone)
VGTPRESDHIVISAERAVTAIMQPNDLQEAEYEDPPEKHGTLHSGIGYVAPRVVPHDTELQRAAAVLNAGKKVAMLVGAGALGATEEVMTVAQNLGAGVAKALLGKAVLPDELPWVTGSIGLLGTKPSYDMMMECNTLLMIGSGFPYSEFLPPEGKARGVQIDIEPETLSLRYPMEVNLVGDATETLGALIPRLEEKADRSWRESIEKMSRNGGGPLTSAPRSRPTPSIPSVSPGNYRRDCPSGRSSPVTPDRAPTGTRATSRFGAA